METEKNKTSSGHFYYILAVVIVFLVCVFTGLAALGLLRVSDHYPKTGPEAPQPANPISASEAPTATSAELEPETAVPTSEVSPEIRSISAQTAQDPASFRIPIFVYHYVRDKVRSKTIERYQMNVTPAVFEEQLKTLIGDGFHFVTMVQIAKALDGESPLPTKPIAITFDDGLADVYTNVFPLLKKYQIPITDYLIPAYFGFNNYLTEDMIKELARSGLVEIGSHTLHHPKLNKMSDAKAKTEIEDSKTLLEKTFGVTVTAFAYPYGLFNKNTPPIVQGAGYLTAVSTIWGESASKDNRYFLPRLNVSKRTGKDLLDFLKTYSK